MRYTLLLIVAAVLPWAWGSSEAERVAPAIASAGDAEFALDILYRQKTVRPRPMRVWPDRFRREQKPAPERAMNFDPIPSHGRSIIGPVVPS